MSEPALYRHLTLHVQHPISISLNFGHLSEQSLQVRNRL
jgi:hypothetical protein